MTILEISAFYNDSVATIMDGEVIAAAQEERCIRIKNDPAFPTNAVGEWAKKDMENPW